MNVLSLFDGISCGQVALERAGISVDNYFASEVDRYAIQVTQNNYPSTIQLGDVRNVRYENGILHSDNGQWKVEIHLVIGGSPCQGFSFSGKQLNFDDPRSKLFFEYVRLIEEINPKWFLLENVRMKKESEDVITKCLKVKPVKINSALVSAQNRVRLYWCNWLVGQPDDKTIVLEDILTSCKDIKHRDISKYKQHKTKNYIQFDPRNKGMNSHANRIYFCDKKFGSLRASGIINYVICCDAIRRLSPVENERLQTLPDNYTAGISNTQRYKCIGNCWTVDVIVHIFKSMLENKPVIYYEQLSLF